MSASVYCCVSGVDEPQIFNHLPAQLTPHRFFTTAVPQYTSRAYRAVCHVGAQPAWDSAAARFVYDAVEFFVSTWEKGSRYEERLTGRDELEAAGFLRDPVVGKVCKRGIPLKKVCKRNFFLATAGRAVICCVHRALAGLLAPSRRDGERNAARHFCRRYLKWLPFSPSRMARIEAVPPSSSAKGKITREVGVEMVYLA